MRVTKVIDEIYCSNITRKRFGYTAKIKIFSKKVIFVKMQFLAKGWSKNFNSKDYFSFKGVFNLFRWQNCRDFFPPMFVFKARCVLWIVEQSLNEDDDDDDLCRRRIRGHYWRAQTDLNIQIRDQLFIHWNLSGLGWVWVTREYILNHL